MKILQDKEGIQSIGYNFEHNNPERKLWESEWIWIDRNLYAEYQISPYSIYDKNKKTKFGCAIFRKEITIPFNVKKVIAWVSADSKYRIYLNNHFVGRGPVEAGGDYDMKEPLNHWYYDFYDLTSRLKKGENIITAEVILQPLVGADFSMGHGGLLFEAEVSGSNGEKMVISSDGSWKATLNNAFISVNEYDARNEPKGWRDIEYDSDHWPQAESLGNPNEGMWDLIQSNIPNLMETLVFGQKLIIPFDEFEGRILDAENMLKDDSSYASVEPGAPISFWIDFGKEMVGYARLKLQGGRNTKIIIDYEEVGGKSHWKDNYIMRDGLQEFETFRLNGFRYLKISISGFTAPVKIFSICDVFTSYPVEYKGEFICSDNLLNKIWKVGRWTNQICMQKYYLDSPIHQEPSSDPGDYLIESLISYYCFGDSCLIRQDIIKISYMLIQNKGIMFHTSYSLLWIQLIVDYYNYSGDKQLAIQMAPTMHMLLELFETYMGENEIIENSPNYMFMDWIVIGDINLHHPPRIMGQGYMTAFYYKALKNGELICGVIGDEAKKESYKKLALKVKDAFNKELWVEEKGLYCDGVSSEMKVKPNKWMPPDPNGIFYSQHTNALAVLYDIAPKELHQRIIEKIMTDYSIVRAQPYFMHFVLDAVDHVGLFEKYGLDEIRRWGKLLDEHDSSWKEIWGDGGFDCDYSHAWSGTPTYQLSSKILGVTPYKPGFQAVRIKPIAGYLKWFRGKVPSPNGTIMVSWETGSKCAYMKISIPKDSEAEVYVPKPAAEEIVIKEKNSIVWEHASFVPNSSGIKKAVETDKYIIFSVIAGKYDFEII